MFLFMPLRNVNVYYPVWAVQVRVEMMMMMVGLAKTHPITQRRKKTFEVVKPEQLILGRWLLRAPGDADLTWQADFRKAGILPHPRHRRWADWQADAVL